MKVDNIRECLVEAETGIVQGYDAETVKAAWKELEVLLDVIETQEGFLGLLKSTIDDYIRRVEELKSK